MIKFPNPAALLRRDDIPIERLNKYPREIKAARGDRDENEPRVYYWEGGGELNLNQRSKFKAGTRVQSPSASWRKRMGPREGAMSGGMSEQTTHHGSEAGRQANMAPRPIIPPTWARLVGWLDW